MAMNADIFSERLTALEKRLTRLEENHHTKEKWDKIQLVFFSILLVLVLGVGIWFNILAR
jgi:hypothetical protein